MKKGPSVVCLSCKGYPVFEYWNESVINKKNLYKCGIIVFQRTLNDRFFERMISRLRRQLSKLRCWMRVSHKTMYCISPDVPSVYWTLLCKCLGVTERLCRFDFKSSAFFSLDIPRAVLIARIRYLNTAINYFIHASVRPHVPHRQSATGELLGEDCLYQLGKIGVMSEAIQSKIFIEENLLHLRAVRSCQVFVEKSDTIRYI